MITIYPKPSIPLTSPMERSLEAVISYNMGCDVVSSFGCDFLHQTPTPPDFPQSPIITHHSRICFGEAKKGKKIIKATWSICSFSGGAAKKAVSEDPTNCELLPGCIDLKHLSVLIFKSVVDCWQVYRIMSLIGCLCFTGCKWNLWLYYLLWEKSLSVVMPSIISGGKSNQWGAWGRKTKRKVHLKIATRELKRNY